MLKGCLPYRNVIQNFWNEKFPSFPIDDDDWRRAELILSYLEVFYVATNKLAGTYYPTSPCLLSQLFSMSTCFKKYRDTDFYVDICSPMEQKFKKYWEDIPLLGCLAACMDPRLKMAGVHFLVEQIYNSLGLSVDIGVINQKIYDALFELYNLYAIKHGLASSSQPSTSDVPGGCDDDFKIHQWQVYKTQVSGESSSSSQTNVGSSNYNELQFYLSRSEPPLDPKLDLLAWWKANGHTWPILSAMVRDLLTAPMSTVASEACFSAGSRVLDEKRSRLRDSTIEMCICLKDWIVAEKREQDRGVRFDYETGDELDC